MLRSGLSLLCGVMLEDLVVHGKGAEMNLDYCGRARTTPASPLIGPRPLALNLCPVKVAKGYDFFRATMSHAYVGRSTGSAVLQFHALVAMLCNAIPHPDSDAVWVS